MDLVKYAVAALFGGLLGAFFGVVCGAIFWLLSYIFLGRDIANAIAHATFWLLVILGAGAGFTIRVEEKNEKDEAERRRLSWEASEEEARVAAHKAAQQNFKTELVKVTETSLKTFEVLPNHLLKAESLLDQAELDFKEGAFAPFWVSIEQATMRLGRFNSGIKRKNISLKSNTINNGNNIRNFM